MAAGNHKWQEATEKEIVALIHHGCFDFKSPDFNPPEGYQCCCLHFVYEIKTDLRHKAWLVYDSSQIDPQGLSTRATIVKSISARLIYLVAESQGLLVIYGNIGNAFIQAQTKEKIYTHCGSEFGDRARCITVIIKTLYGLTTSTNCFHTLLVDFI